jgi:NAD+ synthase
MKSKLVIEHIVQWLKSYAEQSKTDGFVIGISGGIDSAITSTLCALTGKKVVLLEMPIYQAASQVSRAQEHIQWLKSNHTLVSDYRVELTPTFDAMMAVVPKINDEHTLHLALANTRARLRMTTLYYFAGIHRLLVAGTGNKIEDFGVGFFTKYGDGGVDLSPIADLTKSQVYEIAKELGVAMSIQKAAPTDGLWGDDRSDEDQIGASYPELEWAMEYCNKYDLTNMTWQQQGEIWSINPDYPIISHRQKTVMDIYTRMNKANRHKMVPIPVCEIPKELFL